MALATRDVLHGIKFEYLVFNFAVMEFFKNRLLITYKK